MAKFTNADLDTAMIRLSLMRYFPSNPAAQAEIKGLLAKMVPHREALVWLVDQCVNRITDWPGPAELREILCWKFSPADGVRGRGYSTVPGFTPADGEAKFLLRESEREAKKPALAESSRKMLQSLAAKKGFPE